MENNDRQKNRNSNIELIIAIDGIDGAGKTTLIESITNKIGGNICIYRRTEKGSFARKLLNSFIFKQVHFLQIPIYLLLAKKNHVKIYNSDSRLIIMDRCFLSNICYFYPNAMHNKTLFRLAMSLEVKLYPSAIFILDEDEATACTRDGNQKDLIWLQKTRQYYLDAANHASLMDCRIDVISKELTIGEKSDYIIEQINKMLEENHDS